MYILYTTHNHMYHFVEGVKSCSVAPLSTTRDILLLMSHELELLSKCDFHILVLRKIRLLSVNFRKHPIECRGDGFNSNAWQISNAPCRLGSAYLTSFSRRSTMRRIWIWFDGFRCTYQDIVVNYRHTNKFLAVNLIEQLAEESNIPCVMLSNLIYNGQWAFCFDLAPWLSCGADPTSSCFR